MRELSPREVAQLDQEMAGVDNALSSMVMQWPDISPDSPRPERVSLFLNACLNQLEPEAVAACLAVAVEKLYELYSLAKEHEETSRERE